MTESGNDLPHKRLYSEVAAVPLKGAMVMEPRNSTLLFLLTNTESALDRLLKMAEKKQQLVVAGDCEGLEAIILREEKALQDLNSLRTDFEEKAFSPLELSSSKQLVELQDVLRQKALLLQRFNQRNQKLISKSLEIVRYELGLLMPKEDYFKVSETSPIAFDQKV